jgi:hypothetical protein
LDDSGRVDVAWPDARHNGKIVPEQGRYRGSTSIKQSDFGISPISIAGGTVKVKDDVKIDFDIAAAPKASVARQPLNATRHEFPGRS